LRRLSRKQGNTHGKYLYCYG